MTGWRWAAVPLVISFLLGCVIDQSPETSRKFDQLTRDAEQAIAKENHKEAEKLALEALALGKQTQNAVEQVRALRLLRHINDRRQTPDANEPLLRAALEVAEKNELPSGEALYYQLLETAQFFETRRRYEDAEPYLKRAVDLAVKEYGENDAGIAGIPKPRARERARTDRLYPRLATAWEAQGKYEQAEPLRRKILSIHQAETSIDIASVRSDLADNLVEQKKHAEAEELYNQSVSDRLAGVGEALDKHRLIWRESAGLAELYRRQGKNAESEKLFAQVIASGTDTYQPGVPDRRMMRVKLNYAALLRAQGRRADAQRLEDAVREDEARLQRK
jgi:hypothetical protein